MQLRHSPASPYVRKVMVTAIETGLESRIEVVPTDVWSADTDIGAVNPLGKVPTLTTDDGEILYDSPVICAYLDSLHDGAKLLPAAGAAHWRAQRQQALADGLLDAAVLVRLEARRPPEQQSPAWRDRQQAVVNRALDQLEADAEALEGPVTIGQIAVGCALGYLDFRFADDGWRRDRPRLAAWYEAFAKRPSMRATVPHDPA